MMKKPTHSIRRKLTGIIMITSGTAVALACLCFIASGLLNFRARLIGDISTLSHVISFNSTAALTSGDRHMAHKVLNALRAKP